MAQLFTTILLTIHLLAMCLASAGPLLCIWLNRGPWENDSLRHRIGYRMARHSLFALTLGSAIGLVLLVLPTSSGILAALGRFPVRALWFAGAELVFSFVCLIIYWLGTGQNGWCKSAFGRCLHIIAALFSVTNLLYHFPPLLVVLAKLATSPSWIEAEIIERPELLQHMLRGEVISRCVHFGLASLVVSGVTVLWFISRESAEARNDAKAKQLSRLAAGVALLFSLLQFPVGIWVLMSLPNRSLQWLIGGSLLGSGLFLAGILSALLLVQCLGMIVLGETSRQNLKKAFRLVLLIILFMTGTQQSTRLARLPHTNNTTSREDNATAACGIDRLEKKTWRF